MENMEVDMQGMKVELHQVKLFQENIIMPLLNTIQSYCLDTYKRYRDDIDRMEAAFDDIEILKKVVAKHSEKLQTS